MLLRLERVKKGAHKLRINQLGEEIYVNEGKTLKVGLFKAGKQADADKKASVAKVEAAESLEKQKEADLSRWRNSLTEASSTSRCSATRAARTAYGRTVNPSLVAACLKFSSRHTISEPTGDSSAHISADAS